MKKYPELAIPKHIKMLFDENFFEESSVDLDSTKLIIGLHPDEATEALVDTALYFNIRFCVIPCCVFSSDNPQRRLKNGNSPTSYLDFCTYLKEKFSGIKEENLNFIGKNKVLFNDENK